MDSLSLPDIGDTLHSIAGLSPAAQFAAIVCLSAIAVTWIWCRRPMPGPDAATVVEALRLTAQSQAETAQSMAVIAQQLEAVAEDVRSVAEEVRGLTSVVLRQQKVGA
jgi:hypothetical protein